MKPEDLVVGEVYICSADAYEYIYITAYQHSQSGPRYVFESSNFPGALYQSHVSETDLLKLSPKPKPVTLPVATGGQVLTSSGSGGVTWLSDAAPTLKELYNESMCELLLRPKKCECGSNSDRHSHWCPMDNA